MRCWSEGLHMYIMVSSVQLDGKMTVLRCYVKLHDIIHAVKCTMICEMKDDTDKNNRWLWDSTV